MYVCISICIYVRSCVYMYGRFMYLCVYVLAYACMHVCMYVLHAYMHSRIHDLHIICLVNVCKYFNILCYIDILFSCLPNKKL